MKKITLTQILEFFTGLFGGVAFFGGVGCLVLMKSFNPLLAFICAVSLFAIFSFFAIVAKSLSILLKNKS